MTDTDQPSPPSKRAGPLVAVALQGDSGKSRKPGDSLPQIIATGRGKLAEQILELAFAKGVKVREDADLAQLLVKLDLDTPIPTEAIVAVAEILNRVYQANARLIDPADPGLSLPPR